MLKKFNENEYEKVASVPTGWGVRYNLYTKDDKFYMQVSDNGSELAPCNSKNLTLAIRELKNYVDDIYYEREPHETTY